MVSKKLAKWRSKSIKIDLKINIENYLQFSSKTVDGDEETNEGWEGRVHPTSKDGSSPLARLAGLLGASSWLIFRSKRRKDLKI